MYNGAAGSTGPSNTPIYPARVCSRSSGSPDSFTLLDPENILLVASARFFLRAPGSHRACSGFQPQHVLSSIFHHIDSVDLPRSCDTSLQVAAGHICQRERYCTTGLVLFHDQGFPGDISMSCLSCTNSYRYTNDGIRSFANLHFYRQLSQKSTIQVPAMLKQKNYEKIYNPSG